MIRIERVYSSPVRVSPNEVRILIDRLWPRGLSREKANVDLWLKDIAPSDGLREWFGHDPGKWNEFRRRYFRELDKNPEAVDSLIRKAREADVVLLYGARDQVHNNAAALSEYLESGRRTGI